MKQLRIYGLGRSRDDFGNIKSIHRNPYVNCLHTQVCGRLTMAVLVMEEMEEMEEDKCRKKSKEQG